MLWAAMTTSTGTLGLLGSGEFALDGQEGLSSRKRLRVRAFVSIGARLVLRLFLRESKTDVNATGAYVFIGETGLCVCSGNDASVSAHMPEWLIRMRHCLFSRISTLCVGTS